VKEIGSWALANNQHIAQYTVDNANENFCSVDGVIYTKDMKTVVYFPHAKEGEYKVADTVETIRTKAFYKCTKVTKIVLPDTVKEIQEKAFFRCEAVTEINLPDTLTFIGKDAFSYCYGLTEITIPSSITKIDEYAFYNCTNLLAVNVNNKESDMTLGEKWYPTNNGLDLEGLKINWK
ncbi:MAG: leucine-rich repeat domain-containing protein, partial [Clostridia bacterium]|nr:leucine-rich repeat domain-containing protein [Clostridia bacterium]